MTWPPPGWRSRRSHPADRRGPWNTDGLEATYLLLAGEWTQAARLLADIKKEAPADAGVRLLDDSLNLRNAGRQDGRGGQGMICAVWRALPPAASGGSARAS